MADDEKICGETFFIKKFDVLLKKDFYTLYVCAYDIEDNPLFDMATVKIVLHKNIQKQAEFDTYLFLNHVNVYVQNNYIVLETLAHLSDKSVSISWHLEDKNNEMFLSHYSQFLNNKEYIMIPYQSRKYVRLRDVNVEYLKYLNKECMEQHKCILKNM